MFLILLVRDCLFQAILDVMPCSPAIHAHSDLIYTTYAVARLHSAGFALGCMLVRFCVQVHCDVCYLRVRPEFHPATRCASASLRIRSVSGCPETIPKVCPIRVLVLLGSARPCSLLPVRILSCKTKKRKKKKPPGVAAMGTRDCQPAAVIKPCVGPTDLLVPARPRDQPNRQPLYPSALASPKNGT